MPAQEYLAKEIHPGYVDGTHHISETSHQAHLGLLRSLDWIEDYGAHVGGSHPFWSVSRGGWVSELDLEIGETLKTLEGTTVVESLERRPEPVYNIEVEGDHVYRVGESGVLVHNVSNDCNLSGIWSSIMNETLQELTQRFPPPANPRGTPTNWENIEHALKICYPASFKEFIDVYGGCVWFSNISPFFRQGLTEEEAGEFPEKVNELCNNEKGNTYNEEGEPFSPPFYPDKGGLFPFLVDYGGNIYYWDTHSNNPDEWPIVKSHGGWMTQHPCMSIPTMILKWLERDPQMIEMWGDVEKKPPEHLRITES